MRESIKQPVAVESEMPADCEAVEDSGELVFAERIAASVGAWFGGLLMRCAPPSGPFFTSDGRQAAHNARLRSPLVS